MRKNRILSGRFDNQEVATEPTEKKLPDGVTKAKDTFRITVKDDEEAVLYQNEEEPYEYLVVDSLVTALRNEGAYLSDDQVTFLSEALKGVEGNEQSNKKTGEAVKALVDLYNGYLKSNAKNNQYQKTFNAHKPLTEENITNANASIVRNYMKTQNVSDETAITTLQQFGVVPKDFTVADFRANKGKR